MKSPRLSRRYRQRLQRRTKRASNSFLSRHRSSRLELLEDRIVLSGANVALGLEAADLFDPAVAGGVAGERSLPSDVGVGMESAIDSSDLASSVDNGLLAYNSLVGGAAVPGDGGC